MQQYRAGAAAPPGSPGAQSVSAPSMFIFREEVDPSDAVKLPADGIERKRFHRKPSSWRGRGPPAREFDSQTGSVSACIWPGLSVQARFRQVTVASP